MYLRKGREYFLVILLHFFTLLQQFFHLRIDRAEVFTRMFVRSQKLVLFAQNTENLVLYVFTSFPGVEDVSFETNKTRLVMDKRSRVKSFTNNVPYIGSSCGLGELMARWVSQLLFSYM